MTPSLALDSDNQMIGLRCNVIDDYGAYFQFGIGPTATRYRRSWVPTRSGASI